MKKSILFLVVSLLPACSHESPGHGDPLWEVARSSDHGVDLPLHDQAGEPERFVAIESPTDADLSAVWVTPCGKVAAIGEELWISESAGWDSVPAFGRPERLTGVGEDVLVAGTVGGTGTPGGTSVWLAGASSLLYQVPSDEIPTVGATFVHADASGSVYLTNDYYGAAVRFSLDRPSEAEVRGMEASWMWPLPGGDVLLGGAWTHPGVYRFEGGAWEEPESWKVVVEDHPRVVDAWSPDDNWIVLVTEDGRILHLDDGELREETIPGLVARSVWGTENELFVVGASGGAAYSDGAGWYMLKTGTTASLLAVRGVKGGRVIAVGEQGTILELARRMI